MNEITDQLWITDISGVREGSTSRFDRVVTVCQDSVEDNVGCTYNFFNMSDGPANSYGGNSSYELFHEAAITVLGALEYGESVLVHCHMGQSRSVAVSIAALAAHENRTYEEIYNLIREERSPIYPDEVLEDHARKFISDSC